MNTYMPYLLVAHARRHGLLTCKHTHDVTAMNITRHYGNSFSHEVAAIDVQNRDARRARVLPRSVHADPEQKRAPGCDGN